MSEQTHELAALRQLRIDEDITFRRLQAEIGVSAATLNRLLDEKNESVPYDRTLHKIRRFLDARKADRSSRKRAVNE